ncbi:NAD(P)/FAD-dependent oxidoreductase [Hoyosella altamirensis]|uniref:NADPH-dependent 2,4-dienoyl-CoA reductase/sulfur reductase-like enzyme n=1 Tax=Hoyosella altamirensis TaxID=616997 RepID=A0A839RU64_9ACTN|nr:FAD-dependent oxidoreductase [Hoyosella altamirensis]MBB3039766.1 NADPH-dependent 2,4-dienoyl-CoA reductase/sulfur reductase-like enzyme [Hoyosella altamirensis]
MTTQPPIAIVGAGLAGAKVAEALRDRDYPGRIVLIGAEEHLPYDRPPLSKGFVQGKKTTDDITLLPPQWYRDHHVELMLGTEVTSINRSAKTLTLPDGSTLEYAKLALATGSTPRVLSIPGAEADGVHYLRTVEQSEELIRVIGAGGRLVIIGAGWIGLEIAAAARAKDVAVSVIEAAELPLLGALGPEMATVFAELHREHGVDLHLDSGVEEITTSDGSASGVRLTSGETIPADAVLIAVGAQPNIGLAKDAGLDVDEGVLVDGALKTSDPDIVAVGDIAEHDHPLLGRRIRVEHWATALNQPQVAASTLTERTATYDNLPYFFTDQYDLGMEYVGFAPRGEYSRVSVRGDLSTHEFVAFWLDSADRVLAGMNVNIWDVTDAIKSLIRSGRSIDVARLEDSEIPLDQV